MSGAPDPTLTRTTSLPPPLTDVDGPTVDDPNFATTTAAPPMPPAGGERFGDYDLLAKIAQGGMGVVYKARQVGQDRVVALKMILKGLLARRSDVARLRAEAEAAARLDHPGIVPVYEFGEVGGQPFFSMAFVEGRSLGDWVKAGPLEDRVAAGIVLAVSRAVQYAHDKGIVHRDLKPANVMIERDGTAKVTDFGIARRIGPGEDDPDDEPDPEAAGEAPDVAERIERMTVTGAVMGTPSYMAPEQALDSKRAGPPADVYALGGILYACLTGRPPFLGPNVAETLREVMQDDPVPPRELNPFVDRDLETVCLKCLAKQPEARYASAAELADDLDRWLEGRPIVARRVGRLERLARFLDANPAVLPFFAGLSVTRFAGLQEGLFAGGLFAGLRLPWRKAPRALLLRGAAFGLLLGLYAVSLGASSYGAGRATALGILAGGAAGAGIGALLAAGVRYTARRVRRRWQPSRWYRRGLLLIVAGAILIPVVGGLSAAMGATSPGWPAPATAVWLRGADALAAVVLLLTVALLLACTGLFAWGVRRFAAATEHRLGVPPGPAFVAALFAATALTAALLLWRVQKGKFEVSRAFPPGAGRRTDVIVHFGSAYRLSEVFGTISDFAITGLGVILALMLGLAAGALLGRVRQRLERWWHGEPAAVGAAFLLGATVALLTTQTVLLLAVPEPDLDAVAPFARLGPGPGSDAAGRFTALALPDNDPAAVWPAVALVKGLLLVLPPLLIGVMCAALVAACSRSPRREAP
jgi:tRNA A-37 threonylcarbamoyl transferase component Bud32